MVRLVFSLHRVEGMTAEAFRTYWREVHGPLVRSHAAALRIRRYVQLHPLDGTAAAALAVLRGAPEPFDGVAELWFDRAEDIEAAGERPEARRAARALLEDERTFIDLSRSPIWLFDELEVVPAS